MFGDPLSIQKAIEKFGFETEKEVKSFARQHGVFIYSNGSVEHNTFHLAFNIVHIKRCWIQYGNQWLEMFNTSDTFKNTLLQDFTKKNFDNDDYIYIKLPYEVKEQLKNLAVRILKVEKTEPKPKIERREELASISDGTIEKTTIRVHCSACRRQGNNYKYQTKNECDHKVSEKYYHARVYVPATIAGESGKEKSIKLKARFFAECITECQSSLVSLKNSDFNSASEEMQLTEIENIQYAIDKYIKFKKRQDNSPRKPKRDLAKGTLLEIERYIGKKLPAVLKEEIGFMTTSKLGKIKIADSIVVGFAKIQKGKDGGKMSAYTYNAFLTHMAMFIKYLNTEHQLALYNHFEHYTREEIEESPEGIPDDDFNKFMQWLRSKPELPKHPQKHVSVNSCDWVRQTSIIQRYITEPVRGEDILCIQWKDIGKMHELEPKEKAIKNAPIHIRVIDHKLSQGKNKKIKYPYLNPQVYKILKELGFGRKNDPEAYIIRQGLSRKYLVHSLGKSFAWLSDQCFGFKYYNKQIRKDNVTEYQENNHGAKVHANQNTTDTHYTVQIRKAQMRAAKAKDAVRVA
jgi:hypothetical protein